MAYTLEDEFGDIIGKARTRAEPIRKAKSPLLRVSQKRNLRVWNSIP